MNRRGIVVLVVCGSVVGLASILGTPAGAGVTAAQVYKVDPVHSTVLFRVKHMNVSYLNGRFNEITGSIAIDDQNPAQCSFELKVATDKVDTAIAKRDTHLKSPDFFNARQFPTINFKSKHVSKEGDNSYDVAGDMTIHGVTKPVSLKVEQTGVAQNPRGGQVAGFETVFTIKRSEFGMTNMLGMVGDEVRITVNIEAGSQ